MREERVEAHLSIAIADTVRTRLFGVHRGPNKLLILLVGAPGLEPGTR